MNHTSFAVMTDTPARLRDFLISRGVIKADDDGRLVGTRPGMEWVEVPNPIVTTPAVGERRLPNGEDNPDYIPPVMDTRRVFLVKFAHESVNEKSDGFRDWIVNNSGAVTAPAGWTVNGEPLGDVRKINGEQVWLAHENPERFGVWQ